MGHADITHAHLTKGIMHQKIFLRLPKIHFWKSSLLYNVVMALHKKKLFNNMSAMQHQFENVSIHQFSHPFI